MQVRADPLGGGDDRISGTDGEVGCLSLWPGRSAPVVGKDGTLWLPGGQDRTWQRRRRADRMVSPRQIAQILKQARRDATERIGQSEERQGIRRPTVEGGTSSSTRPGQIRQNS